VNDQRLPLGKLPPALLARLLGDIPQRDPRVVVAAHPGVDAAAIALGDRLLIAGADPITFPTERPGWYAVNVNANDIAVMGGEPRWFLATVLLPYGVDETAVARLFADLTRACEQLDITLVGGHTEVSVGLERPIVAGTMLGEAPTGGLITSAGVRPGDRLLLTGGIAVEGSAILAVEARQRLREAGVSDQLVTRAARLLEEPGISVVRAARTLRQAVPVHAMHDATEGGVATALREMAAASGVGLMVRLDDAVLAETRAICVTLGLDPLGLLASGCLVAAVDPDDEQRALDALRLAGIDAWPMGEAVEAKEDCWLVGSAGRRPLPVFARDELARWLEQGRG
jgi:hydrogenase maturation factor